MPNNYVPLSTSGSSRLSSTLLSSLNNFASSLGTLNTLKKAMDNMTDGVSFSTLESACGIPTGQGQTVYNLVAGTVAELAADTNFQNLMAWLAAID